MRCDGSWFVVLRGVELPVDDGVFRLTTCEEKVEVPVAIQVANFQIISLLVVAGVDVVRLKFPAAEVLAFGGSICRLGGRP
jgi:hypothetical protein